MSVSLSVYICMSEYVLCVCVCVCVCVFVGRLTPVFTNMFDVSLGAEQT